MDKFSLLQRLEAAREKVKSKQKNRLPDPLLLLSSSDRLKAKNYLKLTTFDQQWLDQMIGANPVFAKYGSVPANFTLNEIQDQYQRILK